MIKRRIGLAGFIGISALLGCLPPPPRPKQENEVTAADQLRLAQAQWKRDRKANKKYGQPGQDL